MCRQDVEWLTNVVVGVGAMRLEKSHPGILPDNFHAQSKTRDPVSLFQLQRDLLLQLGLINLQLVCPPNLDLPNYR